MPISPWDKSGKILPGDFANAILGLGAIGGAISKDIKATIIPYLHELDSSASGVQSVNTVVRREDQLIGYNTDVLGFAEAIKRGIQDGDSTIQSAVVYGYGGVFNVARHVLSSLGIKVFVTGRNQKKVEETNNRFGLDPFPGEADLFINATPVTDDPLEDAVGFLETVKSAKMVFDHHMPGAELRKHCESHGQHYISGLDMYHPQMIAQWKIFLDGLVPARQVEDKLLALLSVEQG